MATMNSLQDLFVDEIKDLYSAERQIEKALPLMAKAASSADLQQAFQMHLTQTQRQIERLEQIGKDLGFSLTGKTCKGMKGILEEGEEMLKMKGDGKTIDAGLIAAAQHVEHYEMAGYGCARTHAHQLGHHDIERLLNETLQEEEQTDLKLTRLAEGHINAEAR